MKKYVSHKVVEAAKIHEANEVNGATSGGYRLVVGDKKEVVMVPANFYARGGPFEDDLGYLVVYADGYKSWTPSKPFEEGYVLESSIVEADPAPSPTMAGFNPSGLSVVDETKRLTDELMNYITLNVPANRERSIALTNIEQGAMWGVKANFVD